MLRDFSIKYKSVSILSTVVAPGPEMSNESNAMSQSVYDIEDEDRCTPREDLSLKDACLLLNFIQNKNKMIESESILKAKVTLLEFNLTHKIVKELLSIYIDAYAKSANIRKKYMTKIKPREGPHHRSKKSKETAAIDFSGITSRKLSTHSGRFRSHSSFKHDVKNNTLVDQSSLQEEDKSNKQDESAEIKIKAQIDISGMQGTFKPGPHSALDFRLMKIKNNLSLSNGILSQLSTEISDIDLNIDDKIKFKLHHNPSDNVPVVDIKFKTDSEASNTFTESSIDAIVRGFVIEVEPKQIDDLVIDALSLNTLFQDFMSSHDQINERPILAISDENSTSHKASTKVH